MKEQNQSLKSAKEIVMDFMHAWEQKDWNSLRSHISDNVSVLAPGPFNPNTFHHAEAYMYYLEYSNYPPRNIKKVIADSNDVCLVFEITYLKPPVTVFVCALFHVNEYGKIDSLRVVLDPRELFQKFNR